MVAAAIPKWLRTARADPVEFRKRLLIQTSSGQERLADVMDPWQREDFAALDSGWRSVVGQEVERPTLRAYLERARGHSKTLDIAVMCSWALLAAGREKPLKGAAAASDKDQARLLRDAIEGLVRNNLWLGSYLRVYNYVVKNVVTGSTLEILASDAPGNYGKTLDFMVVDELAHWLRAANHENWQAFWSTVPKRKNCMLVIISNAGLGKGSSWQWGVREIARTEPNWYFRRLDGPVASWMTPELLEEQRRGLPSSAYKRLWLNLWVSGAGDALSAEDVEAAITLAGPRNYLHEEYTHILGLDLGVTHDHSALACLACKPGIGRVKLAGLQSWKPPEGGRISLAAVRDATKQAFTDYQATVCFYDPHQCELLAEELRAEGYRMEAVTFAGKTLTTMASTILQVFSSRKIDLYRDEDLVRDLLRLCIVEKPYGYKLEAISDEHGHADRAIAVALALPTAAEISELSAGRGTEVVAGRVG